jgi:uncharacterized RDD family membrane protein YckC
VVVGFDLLSRSRALQAHWFRRFAAYLVDLIIVLAPIWYGTRLLGLNNLLVLGILYSAAFFAYSAAAEAAWSRTLGKAVLGLEVKSLASSWPSYRQLALRNLPKLLWFLLPGLDAILGLATAGDPRQRLIDRLAGTTVTMSWAMETRAVVHEPKTEPHVGPPCRTCGGPLADAGEDFLRCGRCGLLQ